MKIHEYQGKDILRDYGVAEPAGKACFSVDEAVAAAEAIGGEKWVVKAQIHAGGRGKGGVQGAFEAALPIPRCGLDRLGGNGTMRLTLL